MLRYRIYLRKLFLDVSRDHYEYLIKRVNLLMFLMQSSDDLDKNFVNL